MKHIKRLIIAVVVVVVLAFVGVFVWIDAIAKTGVETGATFALGVDTKLDSMDVGLFSGRVDMARLEVANPPGFKSSHFLQLADGGVAVSLGSLRQDTVVLPELIISGVRMNLEHSGGKANYKAIMDNLKKFESKEESAPAEEEGEGKRFVIEKVLIDDVQVEAELLPIGGDATRVPVKIERIELENVGSGSEGGVALSELTGILLKAILTAVVEQSGDLLPAEIAGELTAGLDQLKGLGDTAVQVVGGATAGVEQAAKQIEEGAKEMGKEVEEGAKEVGKEVEAAGEEIKEGLGGLLDLDKKKEKEEE